MGVLRREVQEIGAVTVGHVQALQKEVRGKADANKVPARTEFTAMESALAGKASVEELTRLSLEVAQKADMEAVVKRSEHEALNGHHREFSAAVHKLLSQ